MHDMSNVGAEVKVSTWSELRRRLATATGKALIDHDLRTGGITIEGGVPAEISRAVTGVPRGYQCTVAGLDRCDRDRMRNGWATISEYHNKKTDRQIER